MFLEECGFLAGMNSQPLDPNTADSTANGITSTNIPPILSPDVSPADVTASATTPATAPVSPGPKAGIRTTQFWLLAGVLTLVAWMVFAGRLDAGWFAALAPIAALVYQVVRENLYRDASTHPHDALNQLLETILGHLPAPTSTDATTLLTALQGGSGFQPLIQNEQRPPFRQAQGPELAEGDAATTLSPRSPLSTVNLHPSRRRVPSVPLRGQSPPRLRADAVLCLRHQRPRGYEQRRRTTHRR